MDSQSSQIVKQISITTIKTKKIFNRNGHYTTSKNKSFLLYGHTNESQHLIHHILIVN